MKQLYTKLSIAVAFIMLSFSASKAQVFPQSFEGATFPPTGWVVFDNGIGTIQSWTNSITAPQSGTASAYVQYENVATGIAEDWLVSPPVAISSTANVLSYWERETYTTNWGSVYKILVSTTSQTNTASFTTVSSYPEDIVNPVTYKNKLVNLSAYNGQTVYIAFRMDNDDGDDWYLDNIQLTGGCTTPPFAGAVTGTTTTNIGNTNSYSVSTYTGNIQWIYANSPTGPWTAIPGATTTPQNITATVGGTMYLAVVASSTAAGCLQDTTNVPLAVTVNFPGDNTCNAIPLSIGPSGTYYKFMGASVQPGEVQPPAGSCTSQQTWCNNTLNNTRWFTFVAPSSGHVTIQTPDFDTQLAVWKAASCTGLLSSSTATFVCANDDDPDYTTNSGVMFSSFLHAACLTPGATYFIQADSYSPATAADSTRLIITTVNTALDPSFTGLSSKYCLPGAATTSLVPVSAGGLFTINTATAPVTSFTPASVGVGTHTVTYNVSGCKSTSVTTVATSPSVAAITSNTLLCNGQTATLTVTGSASSYTWSTGGTTPNITVSPSVTTTYTVIASNGTCTSTTSVVQNVSACTAINEVSQSPLISLYPNPNNGLFTVNTLQIPEEIIVTDLLGKKIYSIKATSTVNTIDIKSANQGIYIISIRLNNTITNTKIVKE